MHNIYPCFNIIIINPAEKLPFWYIKFLMNFIYNDDNGIGGVHREIPVHRDHEAPLLPHLQDQVQYALSAAAV